MKSSPVYHQQWQYITNTDNIAKIEDNITWQKRFYWLEYKSQCCIYLSLSTNTGRYL